MLSPFWLFGIPGSLTVLAGLIIFGALLLQSVTDDNATIVIGNYWMILAGALLCLGHQALTMGFAGQLYGIKQGYRPVSSRTRRILGAVSLERMLILGALLLVSGLILLVGVLLYWSAIDFRRITNVLPAVLGTTLMVAGAQSILGGFLLAIVSGNYADYLEGTVNKFPPSNPSTK